MRVARNQVAGPFLALLIAVVIFSLTTDTFLRPQNFSLIFQQSVVIGILAYAGLSWLRSDRQFWHDAACGTRLVTWRPALPAQAESGR